MSSGSAQIISLDLRGQICPASLLLTLRKVNENREAIRAGTSRLDILTDNRDSVGTISEAAFNMGFTVSSEKKDGCYLLVISSAG
jgi:TusA-related sulfurtransferase